MTCFLIVLSEMLGEFAFFFVDGILDLKAEHIEIEHIINDFLFV